MSFVSLNIESPTDAPVKLTRRALAKQRTRERVLSAARRLFTERGYEGATIRDIAQAAGMNSPTHSGDLRCKAGREIP